MSKPRTCPNCKKEIPLDYGFGFDAKLNLICSQCEKIALPSNDADDNRCYTNNYSGYGNSYNPHANWQKQHQQQQSSLPQAPAGRQEWGCCD